MSEGLGELIEQRRGAIVSRFIALLRQRLGSHEEMPASALRDHIPDLLSSLAADLRDGDLEMREQRSLLADAHGALRWEQGFDIREVVADYAILHEAILHEAEAADRQPSPREARQLLRQLSAATSAAVARYVELRVERERAYDEQLASLRRRQHEFISVLSHELKTPLHVIQLSTHVLRFKHHDPSSVIRRIERGAARLSTLVDELLDVADMVTGRVQLAWERVDLCLVACEAIGAVRPTAEAKGVRLDADITESLAEVAGDRRRLYQSVWQLLSNAVKFTPRGGLVRLSVRVDEHTDSHEIELVVTDDGPGISPEVAARMFEPFVQHEPSTTRELGGFGLGLAFVRHVVELHGGSIELVREVEAGAAFRVRIPAAAQPPAR